MLTESVVLVFVCRAPGRTAAATAGQAPPRSGVSPAAGHRPVRTGEPSEERCDGSRAPGDERAHGLGIPDTKENITGSPERGQNEGAAAEVRGPDPIRAWDDQPTRGSQPGAVARRPATPRGAGPGRRRGPRAGSGRRSRRPAPRRPG